MPSDKFGPIVLLTDFGEKDTFSGILKGVIAQIHPDARVLDLSHGIDPQNIRLGAFSLFTSYRYFPSGSVFCVVVDPGVGSNRKGICIQTKDYIFVGPDNGILWAAASENGIKKIIHLKEPGFFLPTVSPTFHGRDVFAPVCAHICTGIHKLTELGPALDTCKKYKLPQIDIKEKTVVLTVMNIDRFGNITLNLKEDMFQKKIEKGKFLLKCRQAVVKSYRPTYAAADEDELFLIGGSHGYMEISKKNGNAAKRLGSSYDDHIILEVNP